MIDWIAAASVGLLDPERDDPDRPDPAAREEELQPAEGQEAPSGRRDRDVVVGKHEHERDRARAIRRRGLAPRPSQRSSGTRSGFRRAAMKSISSGGHRNEAPVLLPGLVVDLADLRRGRAGRLRLRDVADLTISGSRLRNRSATRDSRSSGFSSSGNQYARRSRAFARTLPLEQRSVIRRVVGHHEHGRRLEAVDEQSGLVVERRIGRPAQDRHLPLAAPDAPRLREARGRPFPDRSPTRRTRRTPTFSPWNVVVVAVQNRGDPADVAVRPGGPGRAASRRAGRTGSRPGNTFARSDRDRRDPARVAGVERVRDVEEARELALARGRSAR